MHTNTTVLTRYGVDLAGIELPELAIPVLSATQRQGDVLMLKVTASHGGQPLGTKGVTVVRAESNAANTHSLHGDGTWEPNPHAADDLVQGWLTVPKGGEAFLIHTEEHSAIAFGPGTYEARVKREQADLIRRVAD